MSENDINKEEYSAKFLELLSNNTTLALATLNQDGNAEASGAPYIFYEKNFYIFVSQLSAHTQNLLSNEKTGILISEAAPENIFAATRSSIQCEIKLCNEESKDIILDLMNKQLGETISLLRQLPDFYLLQLKPITGRFIAGFGQAFEINFPDLSLKHIKANN